MDYLVFEKEILGLSRNGWLIRMQIRVWKKKMALMENIKHLTYILHTHKIINLEYWNIPVT